MTTEITVSIKDILIFILGIGGVVLVLYLVALMASLRRTLKRVDAILEDTNTVSKIAATRATEVNLAVTDLSVALLGIARNLKGNQSKVSAVTNIVNSLSSLRGLFKDKKGK